MQSELGFGSAPRSIGRAVQASANRKIEKAFEGDKYWISNRWMRQEAKRPPRLH
jgi:hypothetical protein